MATCTWVTAALCPLLFLGCGGPRLARLPQPAADLSGHWVLDPAGSDDAGALIAAALPKPRALAARQSPELVDRDPRSDPRTDRRPAGGRPGRGDDSGSSTSARVAPDTGPSWGRAKPSEFVAAFALPPPRLDVVQDPSLVRLGTGDRVRAIEPGDQEPLSITDRFGSRRVRAGWTGDELLIASDDGARLKVVEHYRHAADDRLERLVEFSAQGVKSLKIRTHYRRATPAEVEAAPTEGPPAPTR